MSIIINFLNMLLDSLLILSADLKNIILKKLLIGDANMPKSFLNNNNNYSENNKYILQNNTGYTY